MSFSSTRTLSTLLVCALSFVTCLLGAPGDADEPFEANINALEQGVVIDGFLFQDGLLYLVPPSGFKDRPAHYRIAGTGAETNIAVCVTSGADVSVILDNVCINLSGYENRPPFCVSDGASAAVTLAGSNTLVSGYNYLYASEYVPGSGVNLGAGFQVAAGAAATFTGAAGGGILVAVGSSCGAGIGGGDGQDAGTIVIAGGTICAYGGVAAAGIGGGKGGSGIGGSGGVVTITGGHVTAYGNHGAAGIGAGEQGAFAEVAISGGAVIATGGSSGGTAIGGERRVTDWRVNISGGVIYAYGGESMGAIGAGPYANQTIGSGVIAGSYTVVIADGISPNIVCTGGLVIQGATGTVTGNVTVLQDVVIPSGTVLTVPYGSALRLRDGARLTNNGTLRLAGTLDDAGGTFINNGTVYHAGDAAWPIAIDIQAATIPPLGVTVANGVISLTNNMAHYQIYGAGESARRLSVPAMTDVFLTLSNLVIRSASDTESALAVATGAVARITLAGSNGLYGGGLAAGMQVPAGAAVFIGGNGSLEVTGGFAGIGGGNAEACGEVVIDSGTVTAESTLTGAGIGGGCDGKGGTVKIRGGRVTARGCHSSAGIGGGGVYAAGGHVEISGGEVAAVGDSGAAGIGGGARGGGGSVMLTGGSITALGGTGAEGVGAGKDGTPAATGVISGNVFVAASSIGAAIERCGGLIVDGTTGLLVGTDCVLTAAATLPDGTETVIPANHAFTVPAGMAFTNNGELHLYGTITNRGSIVNNGCVFMCGDVVNTGEMLNPGDVMLCDGNGDGSDASPYVIAINEATAFGPGYSYSGQTVVLTKNNAHYFVYGTGTTVTTGISVPDGFNSAVAISNVMIDASGRTDGAPFALNGNADVTCTFIGTNSFKSGLYEAGIRVPSGARLVLDGTTTPGATLVARGLYYGAGIGGADRGTCGTLEILGGDIMAQNHGNSGLGGAGIGGGRGSGYGGYVRIYGGQISAIGPILAIGSLGGMISGNAVIDASGTIDPTIEQVGGLYFQGSNMWQAGERFTLSTPVVVTPRMVFNISDTQAFEIASGTVMTNFGTIFVNGALRVEGLLVNHGAIMANGVLDAPGGIVGDGVISRTGVIGRSGQPVNIDFDAPPPNGPGYSMSKGVLRFFLPGYYQVSGSGTPTANLITVEVGCAVDLVLSNVNILAQSYTSAISIPADTSLALSLAGTNTLCGGSDRAAISVPETAHLTIDTLRQSSTDAPLIGVLTCAGGDGASGIGGNRDAPAGSIEIRGGIVTAISPGATTLRGGAAIGGGQGPNGGGGHITISGGMVYAQTAASDWASAIGAGSPQYTNGARGPAATGFVCGTAFIVANAPVDMTDRRGGVVIEKGVGRMYGNACAVTADAALETGWSLTVTNGQTLVIGQNATFVNNGTISNFGAITVYGTFINNGTLIGNAPLQTAVPCPGVGALTVMPEHVVLTWPDTPAPVSVLFGKETLTDRWTRLDVESDPTNAVIPRNRYRFFMRQLP